MILEFQKEKKELPKLYQKIRFTWVCLFFFFYWGGSVLFPMTFMTF